jgi:hypothetical protein
VLCCLGAAAGLSSRGSSGRAGNWGGESIIQDSTL